MKAVAFLKEAASPFHRNVGGTNYRTVLTQPVVLRGAASELVGDSWLNTPKNAPVTLASRKGKVTILHFWTFG